MLRLLWRLGLELRHRNPSIIILQLPNQVAKHSSPQCASLATRLNNSAGFYQQLPMQLKLLSFAFINL